MVEIDERFDEILKNVLDLDDIDSSLSMETCDNWDSLNHLRLITVIEQEFSLDISIEKSENLTSYTELKEFLKNQ